MDSSATRPAFLAARRPKIEQESGERSEESKKASPLSCGLLSTFYSRMLHEFCAALRPQSDSENSDAIFSARSSIGPRIPPFQGGEEGSTPSRAIRLHRHTRPERLGARAVSKTAVSRVRILPVVLDWPQSGTEWEWEWRGVVV